MTDEEIEAVKLAHSAIGAAASAIIDLAQENPTGDAPFQCLETIENLADALQSALIISRRSDEQATQLRGALARFLDGWA